MKKPETETIPETVAEEIVPTPEYDGYEQITEPMIDGKYETSRQKVYLSTKEQKRFMGDVDPSKYFRLGKVPNHMPKSFGTLLQEDRLETTVKNDVYSKYPDVLLFKHDLSNIYTLLIPKTITEHEVTNGEFSSRLVQYDTRSIPFNGGPGRPSAFDVDFFKAQSSKIIKHLDAKAAERKVY